MSSSLITNKTNIAYLSGFTGSNGFLLLTPKKKYLFTDSRYILRAEKTINKSFEIVDITRLWKNKEAVIKHWQSLLKKHRITELGVEESTLTVAEYKRYKKISGKVRLKDISGQIEETRETKTPKEIALIKKSQAINEKVFLEVEKTIKKHLGIFSRKALSEKDIAWKIRELGHKYGAEDLSFDPIVGFDDNSAIVHHSPTDRKLHKGALILIDMGMKYQGYCSDMTRMIFTTKPTKKQAEVYNLVLQAQNNALQKIKAGHSGKQADDFSRTLINEAGYEQFYTHSGGHGIGLDIHETPTLSANFTKPLKANSIITVEPGIYLPGEFGVRIEDMLLVGKSKSTNLTKIKK